MSKYKCIIFDCDGVLVDTERITNQVLVEMVKPFGLELDIEETIEKFSGRSLKDCLDSIEAIIQSKLPDDFTEIFRKKTFLAFQSGVSPISGISELLDQLKISYCVASSGPLEKMKLTLGSASLLDKFEGRMFSSYEIDSWKPEPEIFLYAAKKMGFKPEDCVVIEDALAGLEAARKGGFDVFGFSNSRNEEAFKKLANHTFSNIKELHALLNLTKQRTTAVYTKYPSS